MQTGGWKGRKLWKAAISPSVSSVHVVYIHFKNPPTSPPKQEASSLRLPGENTDTESFSNVSESTQSEQQRQASTPEPVWLTPGW